MQIKAPLTKDLSVLATSNYMFVNEPCKVKMTFHNGSILIRTAMYSHHIPTDLNLNLAFSKSLAYFVRWAAEVNNDNSKLIRSEGFCLPNELNSGCEDTFKKKVSGKFDKGLH